MVEHKRLVSRVKRQRKSLSSSHRDEKMVKPIPNRASSQIRVLGTLLILFCLRGLRTVCPPSFLTPKRKVNLKSRICFLLAVFLPLALFCVTAHAQTNGDLRLCSLENTTGCTEVIASNVSDDGTVRGRLEMYHTGVTATIFSITESEPVDVELVTGWGGICDDYYTTRDATVACKQLGHTTYAEFGKTLLKLSGPSLIKTSASNSRENNKFWLDDLLCEGSEDRLIECPRNGNAIGQHNCRNFEHAGAICYVSVVAPKAPENLSATSKEQTMIMLEWDAPDSIVDGYKIEAKLDDDDFSSGMVEVVITSDTETTYIHSGLTPGDTWYYRVSAINYDDLGPPKTGQEVGPPSNIDFATVGGGTPTINADQEGTVTLSGPLEIGKKLTAILTDSDGPTDVEWTWYRSADKSDWASIPSATSSGSTTAIYTPVAEGDPAVEDDEGKYLRAVASYTDGHGPNKSAEADSAGKVPPVNWPPYFDPAPPPAMFSVDENEEPEVNIGTPIAVTDPEGETLTYSLDDVSKLSFDIDSSGQIKTKAALDYEAEDSYTVVVKVTDGNTEITTTVTINVDNVEEPGEVTLFPGHPKIGGDDLTAKLEDGDVPLTNVEWTWERLPLPMSPEADRTTVSTSIGATTSTYTPVAADEGKYLRATAKYRDNLDDGEKMAYANSDSPAQLASQSNRAPEFNDGETAMRSVSENTAANTAVGRNVGAPVRATDPDNDPLTYSLEGTDEAPSFDIDETSGQIKTKVQLDYETENSYSVTVIVSDGSLRDTIAVTINVSDVNESVSPPSDTKTPSQITRSTPATVPNAPENLTATPGNAEVTLSWDAPDDDGGSAIEDYEYKVDSGEWVSTEGTTTTYTVTGLTNGDTYEFRVRAVNDAGNGAESEPISATPTTVPSAPLNLEGVRGNAEVTLSWDAPDDDGGSAIEDYEYKVDSGEWVSTEGTTTTYTVTGLTNGDTYEFRVRAVNDAGNGAESEPISATPTTVPSAPLNLEGVRGNAEVTLSWDAPDDGGSAIERYEYKVDSGEWVSTEGTTTTYTVTGLTNGDTYEFRVRAVNDAGNGAESEPISATPTTVPSAPLNLEGVRGNAEVTLSWDAPDDGGSAIEDYEYKVDSGEWVSTGGTTTTYTVTGLASGQIYGFRVRAVNDVGPGAESAPVSIAPATVESGGSAWECGGNA